MKQLKKAERRAAEGAEELNAERETVKIHLMRAKDAEEEAFPYAGLMIDK